MPRHSIGKDQTLSAQAVQIARLKADLKDARKRLSHIHNICTCIGGPLNDNKLGYSKEQLKTFFDIDQQAKP